MAIKQQVMATTARKGNMGRLNSSQPLYVHDSDSTAVAEG